MKPVFTNTSSNSSINPTQLSSDRDVEVFIYDYDSFKFYANKLGIWPFILAESETSFGIAEPDNLPENEKRQLMAIYEYVIFGLIEHTGIKKCKKNS